MGIGYVVELEETGRVLVRCGAQIGQGTNNEAEYHALIAGLRHCLRLGLWDLTILSDSLLVVNQIGGKWRVKEPGLRKLHGEALVLLGLLGDYRVHHVRREENEEADFYSRRIFMDSPDIGAPPPFGTIPRRFHFWQAAAIRFWWKQGLCRSGYLLGRIFGVDHTAIEQICDGRSYKGVSFDGRPFHTRPDGCDMDNGPCSCGAWH
jgi:ribonuclease HI